MIKVFLDSDIILDLFAHREPFYIHAAKLFTLIDKNKIEAFTSPVVYANLHNLLARYKSASFALNSLRKLRTLVKIAAADEKVIDLSLNARFKDFEDSIQYYTAKTMDIKYIITRNKSDYKKAEIEVCTAEEFLKLMDLS